MPGVSPFFYLDNLFCLDAVEQSAHASSRASEKYLGAAWITTLSPLSECKPNNSNIG